MTRGPSISHLKARGGSRDATTIHLFEIEVEQLVFSARVRLL